MTTSTRMGAMRDDSDIIGARVVRDETADSPLWNQRAAAPDVADSRPAPRPVARAAMPGARASALERLKDKMPAKRAQVLAIYRAVGPCTRNACAAVLCGQDPPTPEAMNTVQGRTAELLQTELLYVVGYTSDPRRGILAVKRSTSTEDPAA